MKNISHYILDYLQINKRAIVPGFGVFYMENSGAQINVDNRSISPPSQLVCFQQNYLETDQCFANYLSKVKNVSTQVIIYELQIQTDFWKKKISVGEEFEILALGKFIKHDEQLYFLGQKLPSLTPEYFGLEEIVFSEIKSDNQKRLIPSIAENQNYNFSRNILWLFLLIIPLLVLAYFGFTNKELLFGQKSFDGISIKNSTHRIEDQNSTKIKVQIVDSAKVDSSNAAPQTIKNQ